MTVTMANVKRQQHRQPRRFNNNDRDNGKRQRQQHRQPRRFNDNDSDHNDDNDREYGFLALYLRQSNQRCCLAKLYQFLQQRTRRFLGRKPDEAVNDASSSVKRMTCRSSGQTNKDGWIFGWTN